MSTPVINPVFDSQTTRIERAFLALAKIERFLANGTLHLRLKHEEQQQIIAALAYARSQRRNGISDVTQQHRDWVDAEADLELILIHLQSLE